MAISDQYKKEQDLIFQEIEEKERLARQASSGNDRSWFREELRRIYRRKKFFRALSEEEQEKCITEAIREYMSRQSR